MYEQQLQYPGRLRIGSLHDAGFNSRNGHTGSSIRIASGCIAGSNYR